MKIYLTGIVSVLLVGAGPVFSQTAPPPQDSDGWISKGADVVVLTPQEKKRLDEATTRYQIAYKAAYMALSAEKQDDAKRHLKQAIQANDEPFRGSKIADTSHEHEIGKLALALSEAYLTKGKPQDALEVLSTNEAAVGFPEYNPVMGFVYFRLGDWDKSREHVERAQTQIRLPPEFKRDLPSKDTARELEANLLFVRAGNHFLSHGFKADDVPDLQDALRLVPNNPVIAYKIAEILQRLKLDKEAVPYLEIAAKHGTGKYAERAKGIAENIAYHYSPEQEQRRKQYEEEAKPVQPSGPAKKL